MEAKDELVMLLEDTKRWASTAGNVDTDKMFSDWPSQFALLEELDSHLRDAKNGTANFSKLLVLYAPTAGLCEVAASDDAATIYLTLASRFDNWRATVRPIK